DPDLGAHERQKSQPADSASESDSARTEQVAKAPPRQRKAKLGRPPKPTTATPEIVFNEAAHLVKVKTIAERHGISQKVLRRRFGKALKRCRAEGEAGLEIAAYKVAMGSIMSNDVRFVREGIKPLLFLLGSKLGLAPPREPPLWVQNVAQAGASAKASP